MQFLYSAFSCRSQLKALYILLSLADLLYPSPAQLPGEYIPAYTLQGTMGNLSTIAISVYSQVLIYGWVNRGTLVVTRSPRRTVSLSRLALAGLEPTILWLGVRRANHSAIATRQIGSPMTLLHLTLSDLERLKSRPLRFRCILQRSSFRHYVTIKH